MITSMKALRSAMGVERFVQCCPHVKDRPIAYVFGKQENTVVRDRWRLLICERCDRELHELFEKALFEKAWSKPKKKVLYY